jgi:hypothetical protein
MPNSFLNIFITYLGCLKLKNKKYEKNSLGVRITTFNNIFFKHIFSMYQWRLSKWERNYDLFK